MAGIVPDPARLGKARRVDISFKIVWRAILALAVLALAALGAAVWRFHQEPAPARPEPVATPETRPDGGQGREHPADRNFNPGWIGSACSHDGDCSYDGGFCLMPEEGFPRGHCSARCEKFCPDRQGDFYSVTFCVADPTYADSGICLARCNLHLTPSGCRPGYICTSLQRRDESLAQLVCLPDRGTPPPPTECTRELDRLGLVYTRPDLADAPSRPARPGEPPPRQEICQIDTPVLLNSPIGTVDYRQKGQRHADHLLLACRMALRLERLSELLSDAGVVEVEHNGTYVCRGVAGTLSLSGHGHALAIDVTGFERARGAPVSVRADWSGADPKRRRFLRELVARIRQAKIFDVVLTPESDDLHMDHLHLEIE